jgi:DNA-repair protein complementing XP-A cells
MQENRLRGECGAWRIRCGGGKRSSWAEWRHEVGESQQLTLHLPVAAKARLQALAAAQNPELQLNAHGKRPAGPLPLERGANASLRADVPASTRNANLPDEQTRVSPSKPAVRDDAPLPRDKSLGNYIEYDLSRLHNSKGGFLVEEDEGSNQTAEERARARERELERMRDQMEPGESRRTSMQTSGRAHRCSAFA